MGAYRQRSRQKADAAASRGERSQIAGSMAVGAGIVTGAVNPMLGFGVGSMGAALFHQGAADKRTASSTRARATAVERLARGPMRGARVDGGGGSGGVTMSRPLPTRQGGWPPISDALSASAYAAMAPAISPVSSANTARTIATKLADRGRDLSSGARDAGASRVGKATDKVASKVALLADGKAGNAVRAARATTLGAVASKTLAIAGKVAMPLMVAKAGFDAARGFQKDGVRGAVLGAIDSVAFGRGTAVYNGYQKDGVGGAVDGITFGLLSWAQKHVPETLRGAARADAPPPGAKPSADAGQGRTARGAEMTPSKARAFESAAVPGGASPARTERGGQAQPESSGLRGFQNQGTLAAALAAQGKEWSGDYVETPRPR